MIRIEARDGIYTSFKGSHSFMDIVEVLKKYKCAYDPDTKEWEVSRPHYKKILNELEELDILEIINPEDIEKLFHPPSETVFRRFSFSPDELKLPPIMGKVPYENYQLQDIERTLNRNRYALFLDVGTGKSYILLSALHLLKKRGLVNKVLYITSNSGVWDIKDKFPQFSDIEDKNIAVGNINNRRPFDSNPEVVICNYQSFLLIKKEYKTGKITGGKKYPNFNVVLKNWIGKDNAMIVLDESHNIANPSSLQTDAIMHYRKNFYYRYILSGTPADKEEKYFSQLKFLDDSLVKGYNYTEWLNEVANLGTRFSQYAIASMKPDKMLELQETVKKVCSRRLADEVLILPPNMEKILYIQNSPEQRQIYEDLTKYYLRKIREQKNMILMNDVKNIFTKLILSLDNPEIIKTEDIDDPYLVASIKKWKFKDHCKIPVLMDILADHPDEKIIIWTSHPSVGENLAVVLKHKKPIVINGQSKIPKGMTKDEYKTQVVNEFRSSKDSNILIAGIQVLNTAVTITEATVQVYFDTDFTYVNIEQSEARIYRIGQKNKVHTYKILIKDSLDITRHKILDNKDFVNDKFLSGEYANQQQLKAIFGGIL